ncbi:hypothetical protein [Sinorhizobium meliloti]|uniref:hypothetical protein n=1 Tax=Rhizobium meliloti TaxID=382 RepID=UPI00398D3F19
MRYIFLDISKVPVAWLNKAKELTDAIEAETDQKKRKKIIDEHAAFWGRKRLKNALLAMSDQKCWYTEADDCVSDWHVDHFRPKASYQSLAFDWANYRISGAKPNRKKSHYFPLDDQNSTPLLLDPTVWEETQFITFDEQGQVKPARPADPNCCRRVEVTRERLELDSERLIQRRKEVWEDCQEVLDLARAHIAAKQNTANALGSATVKHWAGVIKKKLDAAAPFTAVVEACIRANAAEWILRIPSKEAA